LLAGFGGDWCELGFIGHRWRENLRGKQGKSDFGANKRVERRITIKTGNWCRV